MFGNLVSKSKSSSSLGGWRESKSARDEGNGESRGGRNKIGSEGIDEEEEGR